MARQRSFHSTTAFIALAAWVMIAPPAQAEIDWKPPRTSVFAVGILQWQHSDIYKSFPLAMPERRDRQLVNFFRRSGIAADRVTYLEDQQAVKRRIDSEFVAQLKRSQPGDLLIFYFAGHGSRDHKAGETYFVNYDAGQTYDSHWPVRSIFDTLEQHFRGSRVLLMADCCYSGALHDEARRRKPKFALACVTSAYSHNSSTGNWTFTDALLKGWRGSPLVDLDGDGQVELREMARYAELDMACFEHQKSMFLATEGFDGDMRLAETRGQHTPGVGRRVEVNWRNTWWPAQVIEVQGDRTKIHYAGFEATWDEWATPDRIRPYTPQTLPKGARVDVRWSTDQKWYPATVLASWYGMHQVHYDGYSQEWDEWVGIKSIRTHAK